jgi:hypothetical protein
MNNEFAPFQKKKKKQSSSQAHADQLGVGVEIGRTRKQAMASQKVGPLT